MEMKKQERPSRKVVTKAPRKTTRGRKGEVGRSVVRVFADGSGRVNVGRGTVALMTGEDDVSTWTDEELKRGARIGSGKRLPHMIPLRVHMELVRRMTAKVQHRWAKELEAVVEVHLALIRDRKTPPATKMRAIEVVYDRLMGRAPEHVVLHDGDAPWKRLIANAIVGTDEQAALVEGEVEEMREEGNG